MPRGIRNEPTVEPTEADYWYAAGFIDGEGCITIRQSPGTRNHKTWNPSMYVSVTISQADPYGSMLEWFQERWGGALRRKFRRPSASPHERDSWEWTVVGHGAYRLIEGVQPMLKIKAPQAENALRLRELRHGFGRGRAGQGRELSAGELAVQADCLANARRLNRRGL
jgi:hypothetical protein